MRQFLSKLLAGGLSAAVVLSWAPVLFSGDNISTWLLRGVAWTLLFELLLAGLTPLEDLLWTHAPAARSAAGRADQVKQAHQNLSPSKRIVTGVALAVVVLLLPLGLLLTSPNSPATRASRPQQVHVTKIIRVVRPVQIIRQQVAGARASATSPTRTVTTTAAPVTTSPPATSTNVKKPAAASTKAHENGSQSKPSAPAKTHLPSAPAAASSPADSNSATPTTPTTTAPPAS